MLVARTLLKEIKAGEFSLAAAARIPILIPPATLAMWRAYAAETDVASLCGREATSAGNLARSVCSRIDWLVQLPPNERRKENSVQQMHAGNASRGRVVRKLFVAGVGVSALFAVPAIAGDLPISEPIYAPAYRAPPIIALNWTGCYLGGHIGGSFIDKKFNGPFVDAAVPSTFGAPTSFAISDSSTDLGSTGFLAGGQVGCNLQFATNWVVGIEADASWANSQGGGGSGQQTRSATLIGDLPGITTAVNSNGFASSKNDFIATATGRLGYTFGRLGQGMVYAKGGAAWARDKYQFNGQVSTTACGSVQTVPFPPQCVFVNPTIVTPFNFSASETRVGWTVGAGIEWAVWENWSVKLEYDYLDLGSSTVTFNDPVLGAATISVSQRISEVKLGVNYRFGSPLPTY